MVLTRALVRSVYAQARTQSRTSVAWASCRSNSSFTLAPSTPSKPKRAYQTCCLYGRLGSRVAADHWLCLWAVATQGTGRVEPPDALVPVRSHWYQHYRLPGRAHQRAAR